MNVLTKLFRKGTKHAKAQTTPTWWREQLAARSRYVHQLMGAMRVHPEALAEFDLMRGDRWDQTEKDAEFILTRAVPTLEMKARELGVGLPEFTACAR